MRFIFANAYELDMIRCNIQIKHDLLISSKLQTYFRSTAMKRGQSLFENRFCDIDFLLEAIEKQLNTVQ